MEEASRDSVPSIPAAPGPDRAGQAVAGRLARARRRRGRPQRRPRRRRGALPPRGRPRRLSRVIAARRLLPRRRGPQGVGGGGDPARLFRGGERRRAGPLHPQAHRPRRRHRVGLPRAVRAEARLDAGSATLPAVYDCHEAGGRLVVADGTRLRRDAAGAGGARAGRARGRLGLALRVFPALCEAVAELHGALGHPGSSTAHVTPSNVVCPAGDPSALTLVDLGIARSYDPDADGDTAYFGTRPYAPPEQFGFGQTDVRTDAYALGMVLFFCLTGRDADRGGTRRRRFADPGVPEPLTPRGRAGNDARAPFRATRDPGELRLGVRRRLPVRPGRPAAGSGTAAGGSGAVAADGVEAGAVPAAVASPRSPVVVEPHARAFGPRTPAWVGRRRNGAGARGLRVYSRRVRSRRLCPRARERGMAAVVPRLQLPGRGERRLCRRGVPSARLAQAGHARPRPRPAPSRARDSSSASAWPRRTGLSMRSSALPPLRWVLSNCSAADAAIPYDVGKPVARGPRPLRLPAAGGCRLPARPRSRRREDPPVRIKPPSETTPTPGKKAKPTTRAERSAANAATRLENRHLERDDFGRPIRPAAPEVGADDRGGQARAGGHGAPRRPARRARLRRFARKGQGPDRRG